MGCTKIGDFAVKAVSEQTLLSHWKTPRYRTNLAGKGFFHWSLTALPASPNLDIKRRVWVWGTHWRRETDRSGDPPPPLLVTLCLGLDSTLASSPLYMSFLFVNLKSNEYSAFINPFLHITPGSASSVRVLQNYGLVACRRKLCLLTSKRSEQRLRNLHSRHQRQRACRLRNV